MSAPKLSYVVIGKNEGEHLAACLHAIASQTRPPSFEVIYVDSGSTDNSLEIARATPDVKVITIDDGKPSAARARNLGWRAATGELVHFVDGDAALTPYWVTHAVSAMLDPMVAAVSGRLKERHPEQSVYNRFADLDWPHGSGSVDTFGGIVLVRREALERCGGFDESIRSGEEPELALRFVRRGYTILQVPLLMATHDLGFTKFSQYWRRNLMVGWAYAERSARIRESGQSVLYERATKSRVLLLLVLALVLGGILISKKLLLLVVALAVLDLARLARANRGRAGSWKHAFQYALHLRFVPIPFTFGGWRWRKDKRARRTDSSQPTPPTA